MQRSTSQKNQNSEQQTGAKIIPIYNERAHIEREIDQHVQSIRTLISRLRPNERQQYFNGLLSYMLHEEAPTQAVEPASSQQDTDYSQLSQKDLALIRELSFNLNKLYLETGDPIE